MVFPLPRTIRASWPNSIASSVLPASYSFCTSSRRTSAGVWLTANSIRMLVPTRNRIQSVRGQPGAATGQSRHFPPRFGPGTKAMMSDCADMRGPPGTAEAAAHGVAVAVTGHRARGAAGRRPSRLRCSCRAHAVPSATGHARGAQLASGLGQHPCSTARRSLSAAKPVGVRLYDGPACGRGSSAHTPRCCKPRAQRAAPSRRSPPSAACAHGRSLAGCGAD